MVWSSLVTRIGTVALAVGLMACQAASTPAPTAEPTPTPTPTASPTAPPPTPRVVSQACKDALTPWLNALGEIASRLQIGLNFRDYSERVGDIKVVYDRTNFKALERDCLDLVAVPAENAMNEYTAAYGRWSDCITAPNGCSQTSKDEIQDRWAKADVFLAQARASLP